MGTEKTGLQFMDEIDGLRRDWNRVDVINRSLKWEDVDEKMAALQKSMRGFFGK